MSDHIYEQMTEKIMLNGSKIIPKLFKMIVNLKEAELMMAMPGTPQELAERLDLAVDLVEQMCQDLYYKGTIFKSFKGGKLGYKMCRDMVQFHDATILWPEAPKAFLDLWQEFMEVEWPDFARFYTQVLPKPFTRVIPVDTAIEPEKQQILDADSARKIIENSEKLAVTKCTCRLIAHKCDQPLEVCIQVNNSARYALDRGTGREISVKEGIKLIADCEEKGLVHVSMNKAHAGHFICNCCECCCQSFPLLIAEGLNLCDPSRFVAVIDADTCTDCQTCHDRCFFNAINTVETNSGIYVSKIIAEKCMGCGLCHVTCPSGAISLKETRTIDFIPS